MPEPGVKLSVNGIDTLRAARIEAGITQLEIAEKLGISDVAIARYERGLSKPSYDVLKGWAAMLGYAAIERPVELKRVREIKAKKKRGGGRPRAEDAKQRKTKRRRRKE